jgi:hypothetical protein
MHFSRRIFGRDRLDHGLPVDGATAEERAGENRQNPDHFLEKLTERSARSWVEAASSSAISAWTRPRKNA